MEKEEVERCDECLEQGPLYDAILDCKAVKLCRRCLDNTKAIEIPKAKFSELPKVAAPSTKEVLFRLSGLNAKEWEAKQGARQEAISEINMDYMRARKKEKEREKAMHAEAEKIRIATVAAQRIAEIQQMQQIQQAQQQAHQIQEQAEAIVHEKKPRKSFFGFFRKKTKKACSVSEMRPTDAI